MYKAPRSKKEKIRIKKYDYNIVDNGFSPKIQTILFPF